jgi:hypothetical protein
VTVAELGIGYATIGAALALAFTAARRLTSPVDPLWIVALWPLWVPLALARAAPPPFGAEAAILAAFAPLAASLPDPRALETQLRAGARRLAELDAALARPGFDPDVVATRARELAARGSHTAAASADRRAQALHRLRALQRRYRVELDELHELIAQLAAQLELAHLAPDPTLDLHDLIDRVARLAQLERES